MRYCIALLALMPQLFINEAQERFAAQAEGYLLSQHSLPHVTLVHFYEDNASTVRALWHDVVRTIIDAHQPKFIGIGLTRKDKGLWGVSLLVERESKLVKQHLDVVNILKKHGVRCVSEVGDLYRPHLTLARVKKFGVTAFNDELLTPTPFALALGQSDENGQFIHSLVTASLDHDEL